MIKVCGPKTKVPEKAVVVNTTSRSKTWSRGLSPFFLGPVNLYNGWIATNVENAWQYAKCYAVHVDENNNPTEEYFDWAISGWGLSRAVRYPMGKGAKPLYSYWDDQKLSYIEARKKIYIPLYSKLVVKTEAFEKLQQLTKDEDVWLWDFDGYDHTSLNMSYDDVINSENKKMGHGFVLAMLLEGYLNV